MKEEGKGWRGTTRVGVGKEDASATRVKGGRQVLWGWRGVRGTPGQDMRERNGGVYS